MKQHIYILLTAFCAFFAVAGTVDAALHDFSEGSFLSRGFKEGPVIEFRQHSYLGSDNLIQQQNESYKSKIKKTVIKGLNLLYGVTARAFSFAWNNPGSAIIVTSIGCAAINSSETRHELLELGKNIFSALKNDGPGVVRSALASFYPFMIPFVPAYFTPGAR